MSTKCQANDQSQKAIWAFRCYSLYAKRPKAEQETVEEYTATADYREMYERNSAVVTGLIFLDAKTHTQETY